MPRSAICGAVLAAALAGVVTGAGSGATPGATCRASARYLGAVTAMGCWRRAGPTWTARVPVRVNGMTLAGSGLVTIDQRPRHKTIRSSGRVRWVFGDIQVLNAVFNWKSGSAIPLVPAGRMRGLAFRGGAAITFTRANGGTTRLAAQVSVPLIAGGLSGDAVLAVSRKAGLDLRRLHVKVPQAPFSRLVFNNLDFSYDARERRWSGAGAATLPTFLTTKVTIAGAVEVANGKLGHVSVGAEGLKVPLGDGFVLTGADFDLGFDPFRLGGGATATFGPPLGSAAAMALEGDGHYTSEPARWRASGTVTLPWLPVFTPSIKGEVALRPGRAMTFSADAEVTVHGWGLKGDLDGFVSRKAFNAEGDAVLDIPGPNLGGSGLFSSKGMAACGKTFFRARVGFGFSWGGSLDLMHSSCDVGRWRVQQRALLGTLVGVRAGVAAASPVAVPAGLPFEVFAVRGADFTVTGPAGTVASTPDRDGPDALVTHDPVDGWAFVVLPVPPPGTYVVTPLGTGTIAELNVADGLVDPTITASVTGTGGSRTLQYALGGLVPGETVSFYQGESSSTAGAEPIVSDVAANGTGAARFDVEPLGPSTRYVFAVVAIDGRPRLQRLVATFDATQAPEPTPAVRIFADPSGKGWIVNYAKSDSVARWRALVDWTTKTVTRGQTIVGTYRTSQIIDAVPPFTTLFPNTLSPQPGAVDAVSPTLTVAYAAAAAVAVTRVVVTMQPEDRFGRSGPVEQCDSAKPGLCPPAPPSAVASIRG